MYVPSLDIVLSENANQKVLAACSKCWNTELNHFWHAIRRFATTNNLLTAVAVNANDMVLRHSLNPSVELPVCTHQLFKVLWTDWNYFELLIGRYTRTGAVKQVRAYLPYIYSSSTCNCHLNTCKRELSKECTTHRDVSSPRGRRVFNIFVYPNSHLEELRYVTRGDANNVFVKLLLSFIDL